MSVVNAHELAKTLDCKVAGCTDESAASTGIYGRLCSRHADERRRDRAAAQSSAKPAGRGEREQALRDLIGLAKEIDRQAARVEKLRKVAERALGDVKSAQMEQSRIEARYVAASRAAGFQA